MKVHPLIREASRSAHAYQIRQTANGRFNVWRFLDWTHEHPGWRIIAIHSSRQAARNEVLERLNLEEPIRTITFQPADHMFDWHWG